MCRRCCSFGAAAVAVSSWALDGAAHVAFAAAAALPSAARLFLVTQPCVTAPPVARRQDQLRHPRRRRCFAIHVSRLTSSWADIFLFCHFSRSSSVFVGFPLNHLPFCTFFLPFPFFAFPSLPFLLPSFCDIPLFSFCFLLASLASFLSRHCARAGGAPPSRARPLARDALKYCC